MLKLIILFTSKNLLQIKRYERFIDVILFVLIFAESTPVILHFVAIKQNASSPDVTLYKPNQVQWTWFNLTPISQVHLKNAIFSLFTTFTQ